MVRFSLTYIEALTLTRFHTDSCASPAGNSSAPGSPAGFAASFRKSFMVARDVPAGNSTATSAKSTDTLCLTGVCTAANAGFGQKCITDHTSYIGYDAQGTQVVDTVT